MVVEEESGNQGRNRARTAREAAYEETDEGPKSTRVMATDAHGTGAAVQGTACG